MNLRNIFKTFHLITTLNKTNFQSKIERLNKRELGAGMALDVGCYLAQLAFFIFGKSTPIESITTVGWKSYGERYNNDH